MKLMAVFDSAAQVFARPFCVPAVQFGVRHFTDEVRREDSELFKHPEDYVLFELGDFDEYSGIVTPPEKGIPEVVVRASSLIA